MRRWVVVVLAVLLAAGVLLSAGFVAFRGGISARPEPSRAEAAVARRLRQLLIPGSARELRSPISDRRAAITAGLAHFADHCAVCHGNDGKGRTAFGRGLYPRAPDLTARSTQDLSDGELFFIIENGVRFTGMPAFGGEGTAEQSWHLVHFVRHLPAISEEELHAMEQLNPRSRAEWQELHEEDEFLGAPAGRSEAGSRRP